MIRKVLVGIILAGAVIGGGVYLANYYSGTTTSVTVPSKVKNVPGPKVIVQPKVSTKESKLNPIISSIFNQLKDKGYLFVNITPKQLATFQGQPNTDMTPGQLNKQLLNGFSGRLLSAGDLESSDYIVNATMNGNPVKVINMIDPYLLQTYSGNAFVCVVSNGRLVPLSEVAEAMNNGEFNIQESYPFKYFFNTNAMNELSNNNGKFFYGTFIG